jgi:hypothetical protein
MIPARLFHPPEERRVRDIDEGRETLIPWDIVEAEIREKLTQRQDQTRRFQP